MVRQAHAEGAAFVTLPEVVNLCEKRPGGLESKAHPEATEPALKPIANWLRSWESGCSPARLS